MRQREKTTAKSIIIRCNMQDPRGVFIPVGLVDQMTAEIVDEVATFRFKNPVVTKKFATFAMAAEKKRGANDTVYIERVQKAVTKYPGKTKEEIRDILLEQLKQMGINAK